MNTIEHRQDSHGRHYARVHHAGGISTTPKRDDPWSDAEVAEWVLAQQAQMSDAEAIEQSRGAIRRQAAIHAARQAELPEPVAVRRGRPANVAIVITTSDSDTCYLRASLDSALAQTWPAAEIVVVDDSSDHETVGEALDGALCSREGGEMGLEVVDHRDPCLSRQAGLDATTAPLLVFLDADNALEPNFLATLVPLLADGRAALAYSTATVIAPDGEERFRHRYIGPTTRDQLRQQNSIDTCCVVRRDAIEDAGGWAPGRGTHRFHDWHLWLRVTALGWPVVYHDEPLFRYRQHNESMSAKSDLSRDQAARTAIMQGLCHVAVVTCFSGRDWALRYTIAGYERLGWEPSRLHLLAIDNSGNRFRARRDGLVLAASREWGSATIIRDDTRAIEGATNDQLANDQTLRMEHTETLGRVIRRLYAEEVCGHLSPRADFVFTLEDDVELLGDDVLPRLLSAMTPDTAAVGAVVNCRFTDYMTGPIAWNATSERPYRSRRVPDPGEGADPIEVGGVAFGATLWRAQVWRELMPHRLRVNDDATTDPAWFDVTFAAEVRRAGWKLKLHPGVRTRHWREDGSHV